MIKEGLPANHEHSESGALTKNETAEYSTTYLYEVAPIMPFIGYIFVLWLDKQIFVTLCEISLKYGVAFKSSSCLQSNVTKLFLVGLYWNTEVCSIKFSLFTEV